MHPTEKYRETDCIRVSGPHLDLLLTATTATTRFVDPDIARDHLLLLDPSRGTRAIFWVED